MINQNTTTEQIMFEEPFYVQEDGVNHINIDAKAKTELGRMLTHLYPLGFIHPTFGHFNSMEGFWGWFRSGGRDDSFRYTSGLEAKRLVKNAQGHFIKDFQAIILEANYFKINSNECLKELFIKSTLPFDHYYIFRGPDLPANEAGIIIRPQIAGWLTKGFEEIRTLMKAGYEPEKPDYSDILAMINQPREG